MQLLEIDGTDQQYLYHVAVAVSSGHCPPGVADRNASWLTTANCILRLYSSKTSPSNNLLILVNYAAKICVPVWFEIKTAITQGSGHLYELIQRSCYLKAE